MAVKTITVENVVNAPADKVWEMWTAPRHIVKWYYASDDWEAPHAENDVREGGKFKIVMRAKDKSAGFDFTGKYTNVIIHKIIEYMMDDGRKATIHFQSSDGKTKLTETFEMEHTNSEELQRSGWQAILDNFKKYAEGRKK